MNQPNIIKITRAIRITFMVQLSDSNQKEELTRELEKSAMEWKEGVGG